MALRMGTSITVVQIVNVLMERETVIIMINVKVELIVRVVLVLILGWRLYLMFVCLFPISHLNHQFNQLLNQPIVIINLIMEMSVIVKKTVNAKMKKDHVCPIASV